MGKKKPFIDKKNAVTYHLLSRPTEVPGEEAQRVFMRTDKNYHIQEDIEDDVYGSEDEDEDEDLELQESKRRELLQLGFEDDGYDYSQHLRVMNHQGGSESVFVPTSMARPAKLAEDLRTYDVLKSESQSIPHLQYPTQAKKAPAPGSRQAELAELAAALEEDPEEEEDWLLQDEFVQVAMQGGEDEGEEDEDDFGLDEFFASTSSQAAAASASTSSQTKPTPLPPVQSEAPRTPAKEAEEKEDLGEDDDWCGLDNHQARFSGRAAVAGQFDDNDEDEDDEDEEDEEDDEDEECGVAGRRGAPTARHPPPTSTQRSGGGKSSFMDDAFERLALDYDSDEIGDLEEDQGARGQRELGHYERVLEKFIDETVAKTELEEGKYGHQIGKTAVMTERRTQEEAQEAAAALERTHELGRRQQEDEALGKKPKEKVLPDDEARVLEEKWDVETIVSTYSNLDNHPGLLNFGAYKSKGGRRGAHPPPAEEGTQGGPLAPGAAAQIKLSRKQGLPMEYLPWKKGRGLETVKEGEGKGRPGELRQEDCLSGEEEGEAEEEQDETEATVAAVVCTQRRKGETAEEKKLRKASIKEHKKEARASKKASKNAFKEEKKKLSHAQQGVAASTMLL